MQEMNAEFSWQYNTSVSIQNLRHHKLKRERKAVGTFYLSCENLTVLQSTQQKFQARYTENK